MAKKPLRPCKYPGCPHLVEDAASDYCSHHRQAERQRSDRERGTAAERGYDARWQRYRKVFLAEHPLCVNCLRQNPPVITEATVVDHIRPHKGDYKLFWSPSNHQALCKQCHDRKTASEDGGFGNELKSEGEGE